MARTRLTVVWIAITVVSLTLSAVGRRYPHAMPWVQFAWAVGLVAAGAWLVRATCRNARKLNDYDAELRRVCPGCGYDMRATPLRCPECGREPQMTDPSPPPGSPSTTRRAGAGDARGITT